MGYNPSEKQVRRCTRLLTLQRRHEPRCAVDAPQADDWLSLCCGAQVAELASQCSDPEHITSAELTRLTLSAPRPSASNEKDLLEAFRVFDRDENGLISENDLRVIFTTLGETISTDEANEILEQVAVDDNGKVKYQEFIKLILKP